MIRSRLGCSVSPTFSMLFASAGKSQYVVSPTRVLPAPTANTISVRFGASETTRSTFAGKEMCRPASSTIRRIPASADDLDSEFRVQLSDDVRTHAIISANIDFFLKLRNK